MLYLKRWEDESNPLVETQDGETIGSFVSITALRPVPQGESWIPYHVILNHLPSRQVTTGILPTRQSRGVRQIEEPLQL